MKFFAYMLLTAAGFFAVSQAPGQDVNKQDGYRVVKKEIIGGEGSWDYLTIDTATQRLYIARETRVMIVDMNTFKVVREIPGTNGVHGVALVPEFNRLFTSNGRENKIGIYDLKTRENIGEAQAGKKPDAIIYDPASRRVFALNNGGSTVTVLDAKTGGVAGDIELGGAPEFAVADGKGHVYVNIEDKDEVVKIDSVKMTVLNHWPLDPGKTPTGLAMDIEHQRLFSGCRGSKTVEVMDADSGKILASLPIGAGVDAVAFDPESQTVFSSNGDGTLTVIHEDTPDKFQVIQNIATQPGARTLALDAGKHQVWLVTAESKPATDPQEKRRRVMVTNTFALLVIGKN